MEDADEESGQVLTGTRVAASVAASPTKEKANSKKSRRSGSTSPAVYGQTDSDSTILSPRERKKETRPRAREKDREWERELERDRERRPPPKKNPGGRPIPKASKTSPVLHTYPPRKPQESEYYGVQATNPSGGQRFRSSAGAGTPHSGGVPITGGSGARSMSYHGKSHPPPSNSGFYGSSPYGASPFPPYSHQTYGSSPYGSSYGGPPNPLTHHPSLPPPSPVDSYLDGGAGHEHLKQRFQSGARPASAIGFRQSRRASYYDDRDDDSHAPLVSRKVSTKGKKERDMYDRAAMPPPPPPPRPKSTRPNMLRPPPPPQTHKNRAYDDESFDGDDSMYRDIAPRRSVEFSTSQPRSRRMSIAHGGGAALQLREPSTGPPRSRPNSYYEVDDIDYDYGYDDKIQDQLAKADAYQKTVAGGLTQALTKDALQKATKRSQGGSSRSTRSSSSHDESEWRNSVTTRTTRSVGADDDFTIKVTGQAVVEVSGTKIQCQDGSAISISSRPAPPQARLSDSDRGSLTYDDRKPRMERLPYRSRAMSQSGYSRQRGTYDTYHRDTDYDYDHDWLPNER